MTRRPVAVVAALLLAAVALLVSAPVGAHETKEVAPEFLGYYLKMHTALAADSGVGVAETAAVLVKEAASYANHSADKRAYDALAAAAAKVNGKDLATLREQFKSFSVAMDTFLRGAGAKGWQLFYCPMAEGYWIQSDAEVRNPYYGKSMLRCGDAVEGVKKG